MRTYECKNNILVALTFTGNATKTRAKSIIWGSRKPKRVGTNKSINEMKNLKKLNKLKLMPGNILNQQELLDFRGGSGGSGGCTAICRDSNGIIIGNQDGEEVDNCQKSTIESACSVYTGFDIQQSTCTGTAGSACTV